MRVAEKASDRMAHVNVYVEGRVKGLQEYGEYIDPIDKAICCYVLVEDGQKIRIEGRFSGTTLDVAYDAVVDGVLRKAHKYKPKSVHKQQHKLDVDKFLCKTSEGIIDTNMLVAPLIDVSLSKDDKPEKIGTVELRLYITRQLYVTHKSGHIQTFRDIDGAIEDTDDGSTASYKQVAPDVRMIFDPDSAVLEPRKMKLALAKMSAERPGVEPWAIFRFHYRSKESIVEENMKMTWDPSNKSKTERRILTLEPVPPLIAGDKPHKDDGDESTRASSVPAPDSSCVLDKGTAGEHSVKSPALSKKGLPNPSSKTAPVNGLYSTTNEDSLFVPETLVDAEVEKEVQSPRVFPKPPRKPLTKETSMPSGSSSNIGSHKSSLALTSVAYGNTEKSKSLSKHHNAMNKSATMSSKDAKKDVESTQSNILTSVTEFTKKDQLTDDNTIAVALPENKIPDEFNSIIPKVTSTTGTKDAIETPSSVEDVAKRVSQPQSTSAKKSSANPALVTTSTSTGEKKPSTSLSSILPAKRRFEIATNTASETKRLNIGTTPLASPLTTPGSRLASPSSRPKGIEHQVAEQRKKLEALRTQRLAMARKLDEIDKKMEPYKKRMAEELARLKRETMAEEAAAAEDEERLHASVEMLAEFETDVGGE